MFVDRHLLFRTWKLHRGKLYLRYPREIEIERERGYRLLGGVWQFLPAKNLLAASICRLPRLKQPFRRSSSDLKEYPGRGVSWKPANSSRIYCIDFERLILGAEIRKNKILSRNVFQYLRNRDFIILLSNRIITRLLFFIIISIPSYIWILEIFIPIRYYHSRKWLLEGFVGQETVANPGNVEARSSRSRRGGGTKEGKRYRRKVSTLRLRVRSTGSIPNRLLAIVRINKWHGRGGEGGKEERRAAIPICSLQRYLSDPILWWQTNARNRDDGCHDSLPVVHQFCRPMGLKSIPSIVLYVASYIFTLVENISRFRSWRSVFSFFVTAFGGGSRFFDISKNGEKVREHLRTRFYCVLSFIRCFISTRIKYVNYFFIR